MLWVFGSSVGNVPQELSLPLKGLPDSKTGEELVRAFQSWYPDSILCSLPKGNFLALPPQDESALYLRSTVVVDDVYCVFMGVLENIPDLRRHYGLSRQATGAMIVVEAYKALRDRAPYPPDQVIKDLEGKFAFILFDVRANTLFLARDRDGGVPFQWGMSVDGSLICSDDPKITAEAWGNCHMPFPAGCFFMSGIGLMSFDHPLNKVKGVLHEDDKGNISAVVFQVDLLARLRSIPRTGSAANWAGATAVDGE
ncbi:stem-specific protein TSJT1-like isoform X2 [Diospyros lotus]|uniref:stem-specific protein TSJT1-like isoform X2 n=1 Tax=Diospyros lotus TaxID=55363 RepID=UPI00225347D4|nr:stem-specific protein TSJT1-like isoform X2 [Diospyros lotus]